MGKSRALEEYRRKRDFSRMPEPRATGEELTRFGGRAGTRWLLVKKRRDELADSGRDPAFEEPESLIKKTLQQIEADAGGRGA